MLWRDQLDAASKEELIAHILVLQELVASQADLIIEYRVLVEEYRAEFAKLRSIYDD